MSPSITRVRGLISRPLAGVGVVAVVLLLAAGAAACDGGDEPTATTVASRTPSSTAIPSETATPTGTPSVEPTPTSTVGSATPTPPPDDVTFDEVGTLLRDNPGLPADTWVLLYEAPGAPALAAELQFTDESACSRQDEVIACDDLEVGTRVRIEGVEEDGMVRVLRLSTEPDTE